MQNNTLISSVGRLMRWGGCGLVLSLLLFACAPKKQTVVTADGETWLSGVSKRTVINEIAAQRPYYTSFSGRAKSNLTINGEKRYNVTTNVRIVHGEAIWISVTAVMGIEAARVLITPDSVKVINRLNSEYVSQPFTFLQGFAGDGLDFESLERLLVGDVVAPMVGRETDVWQSGADGYRLQAEGRALQYAMRVDENYRNKYTLIADTAHGQQLEMYYSDYRMVVGNSVPHRMEISIVTPRLALEADMEYNRAVYDETVELPFSVPSRYTEIQ